MTNVRNFKFSQKMVAITSKYFYRRRNIHVHARAIVANIFQVLEKKKMESVIFSLPERISARMELIRPPALRTL